MNGLYVFPRYHAVYVQLRASFFHRVEECLPLLTVAVTRRVLLFSTTFWRSYFLTRLISRVNANSNDLEDLTAYSNPLLIAIQPFIDPLTPIYANFARSANKDALGYGFRFERPRNVPK
jgi:hypothetical protein